MPELVKPTAAALRETLALSEDLLHGIELSNLPLTNAALKASRLARLLNDFQHQKAFEYEAGGYPTTPNGVPAEVWACAELAGRIKQRKDDKGQIKSVATLESIEQLEAQVEATKLGIDAARDPNVSVSSANPSQYVHAVGNSMERMRLHGELKEAVSKLGSRRSFIYAYVVRKNLELKFSGVASDAFSRIREYVDSSIGAAVPGAVQKFSAIYENLSSENPEDWSNAVHSCRRVLQELADVVFPATDTPREKQAGGKLIQVKLGPDNYINRLICFAEDNAKSERTTEIVGSQLSYLGDRLDAIFQAAQKGSHATISTKDEADRYVVYTYMLVGDLLRLRGAAA
ncbi:MAG TPA: hypothetical protein PLF37_14450 [Planctomycetota bacterium]|nr:hypothetical protein [Planctomycetota bacterium]